MGSGLGILPQDLAVMGIREREGLAGVSWFGGGGTLREGSLVTRYETGHLTSLLTPRLADAAGRCSCYTGRRSDLGFRPKSLFERILCYNRRIVGVQTSEVLAMILQLSVVRWR